MGLKTVALVASAKVWRKAHPETCWVAVTGSVGKTTTAEMLSKILETRAPVNNGAVVRDGNTIKHLSAQVLRTRREHRFAVAEFSGWKPGFIRRKLSIVRPKVGIVTTVAHDHWGNFKSLEKIAEEKSQLVRGLPDDGIAILNADDPHVWPMRNLTRARIVSFGRSPEATLRAESITAAWPDRLTMEVRFEGRVHRVRTQLVGDTSAYSVLAALAAATALGVPIEDAIAVVEAIEPIEGRMEPFITSDGVTVIDDSWKCPADKVSAVLRFLQDAKAGRRVVVFGEIADSVQKKGQTYRNVARAALGVADLVVFVGPWKANVDRPSVHDGSGRFRAFTDIAEANAFLKAELHAGDLVLLKGSRRADHLERLMLDRNERIGCWRNACRRFNGCRQCEFLMTPLSGRGPVADAA